MSFLIVFILANILQALSTVYDNKKAPNHRPEQRESKLGEPRGVK